MATNYATLQAEVADFLHRTDLTSVIPSFVELAETKLNRILRIRAMENLVTGAISATVALPTGFVEMKALTVTTGGCTYPLDYITPNEVVSATAATKKYSLIGDNVYFVPAGDGTYSMLYYKKFDPLSTSTNWLITNAPDVYLYATLLEAAEYIRLDAETKAAWGNALNASLSALMTADKSDRYGSQLTIKVA
jgi:hypothetical protein